MTVTITPGPLSGTVTPPPSKSIAHRAIIAAALADGGSVIKNVALSDDIKATIGAVKAMGAGCAPAGDSVRITGVCGGADKPAVTLSGGDLPVIDCAESGSTLRFLVPVALAVCGGGEFLRRGRLMERPLDEYFAIFDKKGIEYYRGDGKLSVRGRLSAGRFELRGDVSSQFVSGLLFALPGLYGDSEIVLTAPAESIGYIDLTIDVLSRFSIKVERQGYQKFLVAGGQSYKPIDFAVEADYSQAAFYYVANAIGNSVDIRNLNPDSLQGDREIVNIMKVISSEEDVDINVGDVPDLVPALAVAAALRRGKATKLSGAARLRLKESDRLAAVALELGRLGADIAEGADSLTIRGVERLCGGTVDSHGDHRIAMALAVAATRADGEVIITGAESVKKSYPDFWDHYKSLGGVFR